MRILTPLGTVCRMGNLYCSPTTYLHHLLLDGNGMSVCFGTLLCIYHYDCLVGTVSIIEISYCLESACMIRKEISIG